MSYMSINMNTPPVSVKKLNGNAIDSKNTKLGVRFSLNTFRVIHLFFSHDT